MNRPLLLAAALAALTLAAAPAALAAPPAAPSPAGAEARVTVEGMDDIIRLLNGFSGNRNAASTALALNLLKGLGKPDGKGKLDYRIGVSPDGKTLVNGVDVAPLIDGATKMSKLVK